jgi:hypothetical protein
VSPKNVRFKRQNGVRDADIVIEQNQKPPARVASSYAQARSAIAKRDKVMAQIVVWNQ